MEKAGLRKNLLKTRDSQSREEIGLKSQKIARLVLSLPEIIYSESIGAYASFKSEVETHKIIDGLLRLEKKVFVPALVPAENSEKEIRFCRFGSFIGLSDGPYGVMEPAQKEFVDASLIQVFIMPGLGFDVKGNRLGWGKGHYDRFFNGNAVSAKKIGLCFESQLIEKISAEAHDVKMDFVVTEERVIECR